MTKMLKDHKIPEGSSPACNDLKVEQLKLMIETKPVRPSLPVASNDRKRSSNDNNKCSTTQKHSLVLI